MNWFYDSFLPSIYGRTDDGRAWITAAQVNVCERYMRCDVVTVETADGGRGRHVVLSCYWRGRAVRVDVSKKNGAGAILFGLTAAEKEQREQAAAAEKEQHERERAARVARRRPENAARKIAKLESWRAETIADAEQEKAAGTYTEKDAETDAAFLEQIEKDLKIWRDAISAAALE